MRLKLATPATWKRLLGLALILAALCCWVSCSMIRMPGKSFEGQLLPLTDQQAALATQLHRDVDMLAGIIGKRNVQYPEGYQAAADFLQCGSERLARFNHEAHLLASLNDPTACG